MLVIDKLENVDKGKRLLILVRVLPDMSLCVYISLYTLYIRSCERLKNLTPVVNLRVPTQTLSGEESLTLWAAVQLLWEGPEWGSGWAG